MPSEASLTKEVDRLEGRVDSKDRKLDRILSRGMFVGGTIGGAALGAILDLKLRPILGLPPSLFLGAAGVALVTMDKVPRRQEDTILAISLGMVAPTVYSRTALAVGAGMLGGVVGNGNGNGNGGA